jgi:uncharacterized protein YjiS (DUF1127 family)
MSATTHEMLTESRTLQRRSSATPTGIIAWIAHTIGTWRTRVRDRRAFATLDYRDLQDLRLSRWELENELSKPFWRG